MPVTGCSLYGALLLRAEKPLVRRSTKNASPRRGTQAFLRCRVATVVPDRCLRVRRHPRPQGRDRLALAEAGLRAARPARARLLGKGETFRGRDRVRGRDHRGPGDTSARQWRSWRTAPKVRMAMRYARKAGYTYVVLDGALLPIDRSLWTGPLLRRAQEARDEPAGQVSSARGRPVGIPGHCPAQCTARRPSGSGASWPIWKSRALSSWPTRVTKDRRTRNYAHPGSARTRISRPSGSSAKVCCCPWRAGQLATAIHVLQIRKHNRDGKGSLSGKD